MLSTSARIGLAASMLVMQGCGSKKYAYPDDDIAQIRQAIEKDRARIEMITAGPVKPREPRKMKQGDADRRLDNIFGGKPKNRPNAEVNVEKKILAEWAKKKEDDQRAADLRKQAAEQAKEGQAPEQAAMITTVVNKVDVFKDVRSTMNELSAGFDIVTLIIPPALFIAFHLTAPSPIDGELQVLRTADSIVVFVLFHAWCFLFVGANFIFFFSDAQAEVAPKPTVVSHIIRWAPVVMVGLSALSLAVSAYSRHFTNLGLDNILSFTNNIAFNVMYLGCSEMVLLVLSVAVMFIAPELYKSDAGSRMASYFQRMAWFVFWGGMNQVLFKLVDITMVLASYRGVIGDRFGYVLAAIHNRSDVYSSVDFLDVMRNPTDNMMVLFTIFLAVLMVPIMGNRVFARNNLYEETAKSIAKQMFSVAPVKKAKSEQYDNIAAYIAMEKKKRKA